MLSRQGTVQHARMSELQRGRIVAAAAETLAERGCSAITVEEIAARAGVSRKTFYEHFEKREGCLIAALEEVRESRHVPTFVPTRPLRGPIGRARSRDMPGFRVTYRTVRVLEAVALLNDRGLRPSNREIAELAGITDEGQISRMLSRLEGLGVVARDGVPAHLGRRRRSRGEANAWRLTPWGEEVREAFEGTGRAPASPPVT